MKQIPQHLFILKCTLWWLILTIATLGLHTESKFYKGVAIKTDHVCATWLILLGENAMCGVIDWYHVSFWSCIFFFVCTVVVGTIKKIVRTCRLIYPAQHIHRFIYIYIYFMIKPFTNKNWSYVSYLSVFSSPLPPFPSQSRKQFNNMKTWVWKTTAYIHSYIHITHRRC